MLNSGYWIVTISVIVVCSNDKWLQKFLQRMYWKIKMGIVWEKKKVFSFTVYSSCVSRSSSHFWKETLVYSFILFFFPFTINFTLVWKDACSLYLQRLTYLLKNDLSSIKHTCLFLGENLVSLCPPLSLGLLSRKDLLLAFSLVISYIRKNY